MTRVSDRYYYIARDWTVATAATAIVAEIAAALFAKYHAIPWPARLACSSIVGVMVAGRLHDQRRAGQTCHDRYALRIHQIDKDNILSLTVPVVCDIAFANTVAERGDITPDELHTLWSELKLLHHYGAWTPHYYDQLTHQKESPSLTAVLKLLKSTKISPKDLCVLLDTCWEHPSGQLMILKMRPLSAEYVIYAHAAPQEGFIYPRLAHSTMIQLLENNPSVWDLAFCSRQKIGTARLELSIQYVRTLLALDSWEIDPHLCAFAPYFESSPLKVVLESLQHPKLTDFLNALGASGSTWLNEAVRYSLNQRNLDPKTALDLTQGNCKIGPDIFRHEPKLYDQLDDEAKQSVAWSITPEQLVRMLNAGEELHGSTRHTTLIDALLLSGYDSKALLDLREGISTALANTRLKHLVNDNHDNGERLGQLLVTGGEPVLRACCRSDLCYALSRKIGDQAAALVKAEVLFQKPPMEALVYLPEFSAALTNRRPPTQGAFAFPAFVRWSGDESKWGRKSLKAKPAALFGWMLVEGIMPDAISNERLTRKWWCVRESSSVFWWLAQALAQKDFPQEAPEWVQEAVGKAPAHYAEAIAKWDMGKCHVSKQLPSILDSLAVKDKERQTFGQIVAQHARQHGLELPLSSLSEWGTVRQFLESEKSGNAVIEALRQRLLSPKHAHYRTQVKKPEKPDANELFLRLPKDVIYHLCDFLSPYDVGRLAEVCKRLFIYLTTANGVRVWRRKGLGSIGAVRDICSMDVVFSSDNALKGEAIRLLFAWPELLLPTLQRTGFSRYEVKLTAKSPIKVWRACSKGDHFIPTLEWRAVARYFRERPEEAFKELSWDQTDMHMLVFVQASLRTWGLPKKSLDPFCSAVKLAWPEHQRSISVQFVPAFVRIRKDYPEFKLQQKVPAKLWDAVNRQND